MSANRLYYHLKPYLPWSFRMAMRRIVARRKRAEYQHVWPINPAAGLPPDGWHGWPDRKKFAFVLTHDVEGTRGLEKCRQLMELEMKMGFRSSFNFVPEGEYRVSREFREELRKNGFEVGVQDLKHDGKLFQNRETFRQGASRINRYLHEWRAVGFRSAFMFHNLEWAHDLNVDYSSCTFDTDPFEPQPDDVGTIFPFWVPAPSAPIARSSFDSTVPIPDLGFRNLNAFSKTALPPTPEPSTFGSRPGYVELPYTLPQDSTLFLLLQERQLDVWLKKLDWIANSGGMVLLNAHPDYMTMNLGRGFPDEYPAKLYEDFLRHVKEAYAGQYWNALPREVAEMVRYRKLSPSSDRQEFKALVPDILPSRQKLPVSPPINLISSPRNGAKATIWIDLDNTPHVVFFEPIIEELRTRGFHLIITARDAFQVCELADQKKISYKKVGRHYGKNRLLKVAGVVYRAMQLAPIAFREKPLLSLSHGARSQIVISNLLQIPSLLFADYEFAQYPPLMRPTWEMVPSVIPDEVLYCDKKHIKKYPGIKEDVYAWKFKPDAALLRNLGLNESDLIITARPPATEAHYHNPESEGLFTSFMEMACRKPNTRIVLLPRNKQQGRLIHSRWPQWFEGNKTIIPDGAINGLNLIWQSDLLVSGGGTMNREAATLGVPVYSIFRGSIGAVDRHLQKTGRLILVETPADVAGKIRLEKRVRKSVAETTSRRSLDHILNTIEELVETISAKNYRR